MRTNLKQQLSIVLLACSWLSLTACSSNEIEQPNLPQAGADASRLYIAGLSSGAYLTHQLHLAWPDEISGVAAFAGGPYGCAAEGVSAALLNCMAVTRGAPKAETSLKRIEYGYINGLLGNPEDLANTPVYLYQAGQDKVINNQVSAALEETYAQLVDEQLLTYTEPEAGHGLPTLDKGVACDATASPYINACGYSGASASLEHLDGPLNAIQKQVVAAEPQGQLLSFKQTSFKPKAAKSLADEAFYYLPPECPAEGCGVLLVLHGCEQGAEFTGQDLMRLGGFLPEADARGLIVVFPQVKKSFPNPKGCWDWWGYESKSFATRQGPQMQALRDMWLHLQATPEVAE